MNQHIDFQSKLRKISDFPRPGVIFYDITPLLEDPGMFRKAIDGVTGFFKDQKIDKVVGIDARGFLLASPAAYLLQAGLVIVRKKGKLPYEIIREYHELEYGRASLEVHTDSIRKGENVVIIDDVLATGGTLGAAVKLVEKLEGNIVGIGFLLEIAEFGGRKKFPGHNIQSLIII